VALNNNTPLPKYYMNISSIQGFTREATEKIIQAIVAKYPMITDLGLFSLKPISFKSKLYVELTDLMDEFFGMSGIYDIENLVEQFIEQLDNPELTGITEDKLPALEGRLNIPFPHRCHSACSKTKSDE
jgi:hypothetical protein